MIASEIELVEIIITSEIEVMKATFELSPLDVGGLVELDKLGEIDELGKMDELGELY